MKPIVAFTASPAGTAHARLAAQVLRVAADGVLLAVKASVDRTRFY